MKLELSMVDGCLHCTYTGEFTVKDAKFTIDKVIEACLEHGTDSMLLDCRQMTGSLSIFDRFRVVDYGQKIKGMVSRCAIVGHLGIYLPDKFIETVAVNRGINLKVFLDIAEAEEWMQQSR